MAPKARKRAASAAVPNAKVARGAAPVAPGGDDVPTNNVCGPIMQQMQAAIQTIKSHHLFMNIETVAPLALSEGGRQAPFRRADCSTVLAAPNSVHYEAGCNFFG